jgi:hypothetical protein
MIRTHITPQQANILIPVPQNYIGKEVEVLLYTMDELEEEKPKVNNMPNSYGVLTKVATTKLPKKQVSFNALSIDTKNFTFDRNQANER